MRSTRGSWLEGLAAISLGTSETVYSSSESVAQVYREHPIELERAGNACLLCHFPDADAGQAHELRFRSHVAGRIQELLGVGNPVCHFLREP